MGKSVHMNAKRFDKRKCTVSESNSIQHPNSKATDPHRVLTLTRRHDFDFHRGRSQSRDLVRHALADVLEHRGAAGPHHVRTKVLAHIHVTLQDELKCRVVGAAGFPADNGRVHELLRATEAHAATGEIVSIHPLVDLLLVWTLRGRPHLAVEIKNDVREFVLRVAPDLALRWGHAGITALGRSFHHVLREVAVREVQARDDLEQSAALEDGHDVRVAVAEVHADARGVAGSIPREHGLDDNVHVVRVEGLEHVLPHTHWVV
mmetsp:Transcript_83/g.200  ORF Transcript_83/g.200 Transcript_83/m.200 type:complete len:262 (-) Transcript_83:5-790(-)